MSKTRTNKPKIVDLVEQLIKDIQERDLQPGDRYLTTIAASKMLGVGSGVANRTLQMFERRQIISRQQVMPGDHETFDAIQSTLASKELPADSMIYRALPYCNTQIMM